MDSSLMSPPMPKVNYKESMLKEGVDMFIQSTNTRQTDQELNVLKNRIRLLEMHEVRMRKKNEI
jgi:hypothetical protein